MLYCFGHVSAFFVPHIFIRINVLVWSPPIPNFWPNFSWLISQVHMNIVCVQKCL